MDFEKSKKSFIYLSYRNTVNFFFFFSCIVLVKIQPDQSTEKCLIHQQSYFSIMHVINYGHNVKAKITNRVWSTCVQSSHPFSISNEQTYTLYIYSVQRPLIFRQHLTEQEIIIQASLIARSCCVQQSSFKIECNQWNEKYYADGRTGIIYERKKLDDRLCTDKICRYLYKHLDTCI